MKFSCSEIFLKYSPFTPVFSFLVPYMNHHLISGGGDFQQQKSLTFSDKSLLMTHAYIYIYTRSGKCVIFMQIGEKITLMYLFFCHPHLI